MLLVTQFFGSLPQTAALLLASCLLAGGLVGCGGSTGSTPAPIDPVAVAPLVAMEEYAPKLAVADPLAGEELLLRERVAVYNDFALALFAHHASPEYDGNMVVEPGSIAQVLGMSWSGAGAGSAEQIQRSFFPATGAGVALAGLDISTAPHAVHGASAGLQTQTAVWGQAGYLFQRSYLDQLSSDYLAELHPLDFIGLGAEFRPWIDSGANSLLTGAGDLTPGSATPNRTRLVLASALGLEGAWQAPLAASATADRLFERLDGEQFWVPMVRRQGLYNGYKDESLAAYELPLAAGDSSLLVLMPTKGQFAALKANFAARLSEVTQALQPVETEILLPSFIAENNLYLKDFLQQRGMADPFSEDLADFSGINGQGYAYLKGINHSAGLNFGATGLQAKGLTVASLEATSDEPPGLLPPGYGFGSAGAWGCPVVYIPAGQPAALPFIYIVRQKQTNAILYLGQLLDAGGENAGRWECQPFTPSSDPGLPPDWL